MVAGFDGYKSDPLGGQLSLSMDDYIQATKLVSQLVVFLVQLLIVCFL